METSPRMSTLRVARAGARTARLAVAGALGIVLGAGLALLSPLGAEDPTPTQAADLRSRAEPRASTTSPHGAAGHRAGMERLFALKLNPTQARLNARGGERLDFRVDLVPSEAVRTAFKFSYELATGRGDVVSSFTSASVVVPDRGAGHSAVITTPEQLADGYYVLRVAAAGSNRNGASSDVVESYLQVASGRVNAVRFEEWSERSGINQAHTIRSDFQPQNEAEARARYAAKPATETP